MSTHDDTAWESAMSRDFDARVRGLHESPLDLADVKGTARTIKRRRRTAVAGAALAAAAVVVPSALLIDLPGGSDAGPAPAQSPSEAPTVTHDVTPSYVVGGVWHRADGSEVALPRDDYGSAVTWDDQLVAVRIREGAGGNWTASIADVIDARGTVVDTFETVGGVAVNESGTTLAWLDEDLNVMTRWDGGEVSLGTVDANAVDANRVVAVTGGPNCNDAEVDPDADGCSVFTPTTVNDSHGLNDFPVDGDRAVVHDAQGSTLLATDEYPDDASSCGGLVGDLPDGRLGFVWRSCDYTPVELSPTGTYVAATDSYRDGIGDGWFAILDAADGSELARYETGRDSFIAGYAWADESHLALAVHDYSERAFRILTLGTDGTVGEVGEPVSAQDVDNPFTLVGH